MRDFTDKASLAFLEANSDLLTDEAKRLINEGKMKIVECNHYHSLDLSTSPTKLLRLSSVKVDGVSTFDKGATPAAENIVWKGLQVGHYKGTDANAVLGGVVYSSVVDANIDPAWWNGTLIFSQDNNEILRIPVKRMYQGAASDRSLENEGVNFDNFRFIKANTLLDIDFEYPEGVAITPGAGNKFLVSLNFKGGQTSPR